MTFDYDVYYRQDCLVPLFLVAFCSVLMTSVVISLINKGAGMKFLTLIKMNMPRVVFVMIFVFLLVVNSIHLFRGGIYLLFEKQEAAVQISGTVQEICEIDAFTGSKYDVQQNFGRGECLIIDGQKYYVMACENITVGDVLVITVLPKSHFVLEIQKAVN